MSPAARGIGGGTEPGRADPAGFAAARLRFLVCRLSEYDELVPSLSHRVLLWAAGSVDGVYADVAFRPHRRELERRERAGESGWTATGCGEPPRRFDVVGVSIAVAQEALNLPRLMRSSGLPLGFQDRMDDPDCPLVILGGHSAGAVPFLHGPVVAGGACGTGGGLVDAVVIGDGITAVREVLGLVARLRAEGASRREVLREMAATIPGVYVPSMYEHSYAGGASPGDAGAVLPRGIRACDADAPLPVRRRDDPPEAWRGYDGAYIPWSERDGEETLPVAVGCPHRCRFCRDGWASGPYRQIDPDLVAEIALGMKANLAASDLNLLSSDLGCYPALPALLASLLGIFPRISAKSLAGISLLGRPWLASLLPRLGKRELTVGIEGVSERLRRRLGKRIDARALPGTLGSLARRGLRQVKLFFIVTAEEDDADVAELDAFLAAIRAEAETLRVIVSVMPLLPAPGTPLQFRALRGPPDGILDRLRRAAKGHRCEFRVPASPAEIRAALLLMRAGRAATHVLVGLSISDRVLYEGEIDARGASLVERRLAQAGIDPGALASEVPADAVLPWDDIETGTPRARLAEEYERARSEVAAAADPAPGRAPAGAVAAVDVPDPFRERSREVVPFVVGAVDRDRPAATLARGALRRLLLADVEAARAYAGLARVVGLPGASGLRLAVAEFRADRPRGSTPRSGAGPAVPSPAASDLPERPVFLARIPAAPPGAIDALGTELAARRPRVRFRVDVVAGRRRLLVAKGFRNRLGMSAAWESPGGLRLLLSEASDRLLDRLRGRPGPGTLDVVDVVAILDPAGPRCPRCGETSARVVAASQGIEGPICPECLD